MKGCNRVTEKFPKEMMSEPELSIYSVPDMSLSTRHTTLNQIHKKERNENKIQEWGGLGSVSLYRMYAYIKMREGSLRRS